VAQLIINNKETWQTDQQQVDMVFTLIFTWLVILLIWDISSKCWFREVDLQQAFAGDLSKISSTTV